MVLDNHVYLRVGEEWRGVLEMWVPGLEAKILEKPFGPQNLNN